MLKEVVKSSGSERIFQEESEGRHSGSSGVLAPSGGSRLPLFLSLCLGGFWRPTGLRGRGQMDSGWGVVLGKGLCQSREPRRVHPRHQIQQMDQEANKQ